MELLINRAATRISHLVQPGERGVSSDDTSTQSFCPIRRNLNLSLLKVYAPYVLATTNALMHPNIQKEPTRSSIHRVSAHGCSIKKLRVFPLREHHIPSTALTFRTVFSPNLNCKTSRVATGQKHMFQQAVFSSSQVICTPSLESVMLGKPLEGTFFTTRLPILTNVMI